jgi:uncharacterized membrane protein YbaN (DUF454 family)
VTFIVVLPVLLAVA